MEYEQFANELKDCALSELLVQSEYESYHVMLNASWGLVSKSLSTEIDESRIFKPAIKRFATRLRKRIDWMPGWFDDQLSRDSKRSGAYVLFAGPPIKSRAVGQMSTLDSHVEHESATEKLLARTVFDRRFPLNIEPTGKRTLVTVVLPQGKLAIRHVYSRGDIGGYVVASDLQGVVWAQRVLRASVGESGEGPFTARAELVVHEKTVWLFAISETEMIIESFEIESGKPVCALNSLLFNTSTGDSTNSSKD